MILEVDGFKQYWQIIGPAKMLLEHWSRRMLVVENFFLLFFQWATQVLNQSETSVFPRRNIKNNAKTNELNGDTLNVAKRFFW